MKRPASHYEGVKHLVRHGYDKGKTPSKRHQQQQIAIAERRLALFKQRERENVERQPSPATAKRRK